MSNLEEISTAELASFVRFRLVPVRSQIGLSRALEALGSLGRKGTALTLPDLRSLSLADSPVGKSNRQMGDLAQIYHLAKFTCEMMSVVMIAGQRLERMMARGNVRMGPIQPASELDAIVKWSTFALQVFPMLIQGILLAEQTIGSGNGDHKKALVMGAVTPFLSGEDGAVQAQSSLSEAIDNTVATLNAAGKLPAIPAARKPQG